MMGTLMARPSTISSTLPLAAPPIASTLSTPITASAITMVRMAPAKLVAGPLTRWLLGTAALPA